MQNLSHIQFFFSGHGKNKDCPFGKCVADEEVKSLVERSHHRTMTFPGYKHAHVKWAPTCGELRMKKNPKVVMAEPGSDKNPYRLLGMGAGAGAGTGAGAEVVEEGAAVGEGELGKGQI